MIYFLKPLWKFAQINNIFKTVYLLGFNYNFSIIYLQEGSSAIEISLKQLVVFFGGFGNERVREMQKELETSMHISMGNIWQTTEY